MAYKNINNEWAAYVQAAFSNDRREVAYEARMEAWQAKRDDILTMEINHGKIDEIKDKIVEVQETARELQAAYDEMRAKIPARKIKKGYETEQMAFIRKKIHNCTVMVLQLKAAIDEVVKAQRDLLLAEHDRNKPKSVELHMERVILDRFKRAFVETGIDGNKLCEILGSATGKEYHVDYIPVANGAGEYYVYISLLEYANNGEAAKTIYSRRVGDDVEFSSPDLSDIKPTLEYLYHIEDYIHEDFENINAETAFLFKHILTAIEPKYFELKKADNAPKK